MNTPLTDARSKLPNDCIVDDFYVHANFARKLERDRARLIEFAKEVQKLFMAYGISAHAENILAELEADK